MWIVNVRVVSRWLRRGSNRRLLSFSIREVRPDLPLPLLRGPFCPSPAEPFHLGVSRAFVCARSRFCFFDPSSTSRQWSYGVLVAVSPPIGPCFHLFCRRPYAEQSFGRWGVPPVEARGCQALVLPPFSCCCFPPYTRAPHAQRPMSLPFFPS